MITRDARSLQLWVPPRSNASREPNASAIEATFKAFDPKVESTVNGKVVVLSTRPHCYEEGPYDA